MLVSPDPVVLFQEERAPAALQFTVSHDGLGYLGPSRSNERWCMICQQYCRPIRRTSRSWPINILPQTKQIMQHPSTINLKSFGRVPQRFDLRRQRLWTFSFPRTKTREKARKVTSKTLLIPPSCATLSGTPTHHRKDEISPRKRRKKKCGQGC